MSDKDKTTTCRADRRKAENFAAERIAAWLTEHIDDDEFSRTLVTDPGGEEFDWPDPAKLAAAIREGRWRYAGLPGENEF